MPRYGTVSFWNIQVSYLSGRRGAARRALTFPCLYEYYARREAEKRRRGNAEAEAVQRRVCTARSFHSRSIWPRGEREPAASRADREKTIWNPADREVARSPSVCLPSLCPFSLPSPLFPLVFSVSTVAWSSDTNRPTNRTRDRGRAPVTRDGIKTNVYSARSESRLSFVPTDTEH